MTAPDHTTRAEELRAMKAAPRVKPLVWNSHGYLWSWWSEPDEWYRIREDGQFHVDYDDETIASCDTLEAAKAAAQADYAARILAALEPAPDLATEAADLHDALAAAQAENARLREALEDFANAKLDVISGRHPSDRSGQSDVDDMTPLDQVEAMQADARAALDATP